MASEWVRKLFKGNKVWMATNQNGNPLTDKNKVLIKYQLDQEHEYWVKADQIHDIDLTSSIKEKPRNHPSKNKKLRPKTGQSDVQIKHEDGTINIYTDGASSGNPGPSGIGIIMEYGRHQREISRYIGDTTNNVAELMAVKTALLELKRKDIPVKLYTDSKYVYSLLMEGWKAKKNLDLVNSIKQLMSQFSALEIIKVKGHAGIDGNEKADQLATQAIHAKK